jgi:fatty-acyl-CoA synthase
MDGKSFRAELRRRLEGCRDRILLRVALSPELANPVELTGGDILAMSEELAGRYAAADSDVVLLLLPHSVELFLLHIGLLLAGRLPAVLAWPTSRIDPEKYQRNLLHQLRNLPASQLITLPLLAGNLQAGLPYPATGCPIAGAEQHARNFIVPLPLATEGEAVQREPGVIPGDALFLQFSGGTTGAQKAVVVTAPMLVEQLRLLAGCLGFTESDAVVSWLPMYHDMGLIACLWLPLWTGAASLQFAAGDWLLKPELLFQYIERYHGTFCWLPNFAFSYLAGQRERMEGSFSLGHVRAWINCSEPVRLRSIEGFAGAFADWGVRTESVQACYAMAETVFAVTQTKLGGRPVVFPRSEVRQRSVAFEELAFSLIDDVYVASGPALERTEIRIVNGSGELCGTAQPGEIQLRTPSLFSGYWGSQGFVSQAISRDGWYATADYGFMVEGQLFVIGRMKDIIIVGGQNVFPEDIEIVVNTLPEVYSGRVVAFGITDDQYGTENVAVVAELRGNYEAAAAKAVERQIHKLVLATIGIAPRHVLAAPERWIVKSTAGKISRKETRERFLKERMSPKGESKAGSSS